MYVTTHGVRASIFLGRVSFFVKRIAGLNIHFFRANWLAMDAPELQIIYVTGFNAAGKTTLSEQLAEKLADQGWHFIDGDAFVNANPELDQSIVDACSKVIDGQKVIDIMRGTLGNQNLVEENSDRGPRVRIRTGGLTESRQISTYPR